MSRQSRVRPSVKGGNRIKPKVNTRKNGLALYTVAAGLIVAALVVLVGVFLLLLQSGPKPPVGDGVATSENPGATRSGGVLSSLTQNLPTIEGGQYNLAGQTGKPVLVFLSASWCTPCLGEIPKLAQLHNTYKAQGLQVVALDLETGENAATWKNFKLQGKGADHIWALDPGDKVTLSLGVQSTDTKIVFNREGKEIFRTVGPTPYEVLDKNVKEALK